MQRQKDACRKASATSFSSRRRFCPVRAVLQKTLIPSSFFYRYVSIEKEQLLELKENMEDMMNALDIRGKIRLSVEGINATASGRESSMKEFERRMKSTDGQFVNLDLSQVDFKSEHVKESHLLSGWWM